MNFTKFFRVETKKNTRRNDVCLFDFGDSGGIQTPNLLIRSQLLYSVKLRSRSEIVCKGTNFFSTDKLFFHFFCSALHKKLSNRYLNNEKKFCHGAVSLQKSHVTEQENLILGACFCKKTTVPLSAPAKTALSPPECRWLSVFRSPHRPHASALWRRQW